MTAEARAKLLEKFALGGGVSLGGAVLLLATLSPETIRAVVSMGAPGALVTFGCVAIFVVDRRFGQGLAELRNMAEASKGLTGAVEKLAERDVAHMQATEAAIGYVAQSTERMMKQRTDDHALLSAIARKLEVEHDE